MKRRKRKRRMKRRREGRERTERRERGKREGEQQSGYIWHVCAGPLQHILY